MNIIGRLIALFAALLLTGCEAREPGRVVAADYDRFWLWAGVDAPDDLASAEEVYLLAGEIRGAEGDWISLLANRPRNRPADLWLVVRTDTLSWPDTALPALVRELDRWQASGNRVIGLQVDFDAATRGLDGYAQFLRRVRADLPDRYRLSITGLMDWSANGDPTALEQLSGIVDEVVIQTYQARSTIPGYEAYFVRMDAFPIPFKVGLVEGGIWQPPPNLEDHPRFGGYVVFLTGSS